MADVIYKKGQSSNLDNVQIKEGQILVTEDTGEMYIDVTNSDRKKINEINLKNGSSDGSTRSIGSKKEDSSYKLGDHAIAEGQGTAASGIASHAEGMESQSGSKAFTIVGVDKNNKTYTLDSIEGLSVGDVYSAHVLYTTGASSQAENYGKITAISGNVVTVDKLWCEGEFATSDSYISGGYDGEKNTFRIIAKPNVGTRVIGDISHAEGVSTKALGKGSHAEGKGTVAHGSWSHAEGNNTKAAYNAHAEGQNTKAYGHISHAEGAGSETSGYGSHAEGGNTKAIGGFSHAEGDTTQALSESAHAEGYHTTASGNYSHAEGYHTTASGFNSHAEGGGSKALGVGSHAEGSNTTASEDCSHAEGSNTTASGRSSHAEGDSTTAEGGNSHAEGSNTTALGSNSHAEGSNTTAEGGNSHAEGYGTNCLGSGSHTEGSSTTVPAGSDACHAEGWKTTASNKNSHAEGGNTTASGYSSHAEGHGTNASADYSHAEGYATKASADYSHTEGYATKASGLYSHVQGRYNVIDNNNKYADIIGNGDNDTKRSNAATVDWSGNAWYAGDVYVGSTSKTNKDEGSKKLASEEYVNEEIAKQIEVNLTQYIDQSYDPLSENAQSGKAVAEAVSDKQDSLVSGTNIKTINNQSILGSGNITIERGSDVEVDQTYTPDSENAQSGKAVAEAINNNVMPNLENRHILFIGDSYSCNWDTCDYSGWCLSCINQIRTALGQNPIKLDKDPGNFNKFNEILPDHYKAITVSGIGFSVAAAADKDEPALTVSEQLEVFIENNRDFMSKVTDVVFALGYNDARNVSYAQTGSDFATGTIYNLTASPTSGVNTATAAINTGIAQCAYLINTNAPRCINKYLFSIGCGSNPSVRYAAEYVYTTCYRNAAAGYGLIYSDLRYIMYNSELYYKGDWIHPNKAGTDTIASAIFNTLLGNSSILTPFYKSYSGNIGGSTYGIGNLFTVNSNLAQFNLNFIQVNYGEAQQIDAFGEFDICKIDNLIPFGHVKGNYFDLNPILVTFKNGDIVENVMCNFHLTKIINPTDSNEISAGTRPSVACRYDTYLTLCNSTPRTFEFTELYMHNGIINIHSCF